MHCRIAAPALLALLTVSSPADLPAQAPDFELEAAFAYQTHYPQRLNEGCGTGFGLVPSLRLRYRTSRLFVAELGVGSQFEVKTEHQTGCGIAIPPLPAGSRTAPAFDIGTGSPSVVSTGRLVLTPIENDYGSFRTFAGAAWYVGRNTPAWLVGGGLRSATSWGAVIFDVERWTVGVPYRLLRETYHPEGNIVENLGNHREWSTHWQFRLGFAVWQS